MGWDGYKGTGYGNWGDFYRMKNMGMRWKRDWVYHTSREELLRDTQLGIFLISLQVY